MNDNLETLAEKYLGIPYRHGGRDHKGLDCLGLIYLFYRDYGIKIPSGDGNSYSQEWYMKDPQRLISGINRMGRPVSPSELQPLDLVYFRIGGAITHMGVMIDSRRFLHVLKDRVSQISILNPSWRRRLAGARRLA